jgi:His-Xaa-Ser system radical SAM maturase HxsC
MTPLPLDGRARRVDVKGSPNRRVLRLCDPHTVNHADQRDMAIVREAADIAVARDRGFSAAIVIGDPLADTSGFALAMYLDPRFGYLDSGDVIAVDSGAGRFRSLYRRASRHNSFLVTERCNHYCLMCSQPPKDIDDGWIIDEIAQAIDLIDPKTKSIGFTGGEPLLERDRFIGLLAKMRDQLSQTGVHVLSNGRAFADDAVVTAWAAIRHPDLMIGIPVYSAVDHIHDYVVQAAGAFDETVLGILRLKDKGQRVEVRVVLHAMTAPRLRETCQWFARNLPFVDHIALMGLENTGFTLANQDLLWIDPVDYADDLTAGVNTLKRAGIHVSVYNLPLCLLDRSIWDIAVQSISDWKNAYLPVCDECGVRDRCSGFFSTGRPRTSRGIQPVGLL